MNQRYITVALTAAALLLTTQLSVAQEAAESSQASAKSAAARKADIAARRKAAAKIKQVNINSASAQQLKKLPGVSDAEAAKIIAGRPYGSKAWLVTKNIIPESTYEGIKALIAAGPLKDPVKNKAFLESMKRQ